MVAERLTVTVAERRVAPMPVQEVAREIVWLGEPTAEVRSLVGGKVAPLSRLAAQFRVPPGFCLTTQAYDIAGAGAGPAGAFDTSALTAPADGSDAAAPADSSELAVAADGRLLPDSLKQEVLAAYQRLAEMTGVEPPAVAVRSSAVDEDGAATSFAGQHDTYLNVVGAEAVCDAIVRCWASARAPRAMEYRRQQGLPTDSTRIAVLVQQLVLADVSGVIFSANPLTGQRDEAVINASWGLGESIVGGSVTPDSYVVRTAGGAGGWSITERGLAEKRRMTVAISGGTREVDVPRLLRLEPSLADRQIIEMAQLAHDLERTMGFPVDLECAYRDDVLYLLQCRPITALGGRGATASA
jgi:pyruvate,water dikinase